MRRILVVMIQIAAQVSEEPIEDHERNLHARKPFEEHTDVKTRMDSMLSSFFMLYRDEQNRGERTSNSFSQY